MKYFTVQYVSQKTLHPDGYKTFTSFVAADTKHAAKLKSLEILAAEDPACCMMYKVPRLDEISQESYLRSTSASGAPAPLDMAAIDQLCALLAIFGEQDEYDDAERRDAVDLLACPDDEPEVYAEYLSLNHRVHQSMGGWASTVSQAEAQAIVMQLFNGEWLGEVESANALTAENKTDLFTDSVDNTLATGADADAETGPAPDEPALHENRPLNDARSQESGPPVATRYWPDVELDIVLALTPSVEKTGTVDDATLTWARRKVERCPEDMLVWVLALRKVDGILDFGRDFVFDIVRESPEGLDKAHDPAELDAYVAGFVRQYGMMYAKHQQYFVAPAAGAPALAETDAAGTGQSAPDALAEVDIWVSLEQDADDEWEEIRCVAEAQLTEDAADVPFDVPAILTAFPPVNGLVESGAELVFDDLNARLAKIPLGHSLILTNLANETYHAAEGYSSTTLRDALSGGMAKVQWRRQAPRKTEDSPALSLGTAVHTAILEPERFAAEYACAPQVNLRTNDGKEQMTAFEVECQDSGKVPLKADDYATVTLMRDSALAYPTVSELLANGAAELSIFYRTHAGMLLKVRPDWLGCYGRALFILDVKTTDDVLDFGKSVEKFGYHVQAAFYEHVIQQALGLQADFAFCAIGKRIECGRYPVQLGILDDEDSQEGALQMQEALAVIAAGSDAGVALISRPWWAKQADRKRREAKSMSEAFAGGAA